MKKFMMSLMLLLLNLSVVKSASTDTLKEVREKVVELRIERVEPDAQETKKTDKKSKARIENLGKGYSICTGAVMSSRGDILTARHCTENANKIEVTFSDGRTYKAAIMAQSTRHDLALIHVDRFNTPFFKIASGIAQGEKLFVLGSPLGLTATLTEGIVAKKDGDIDFIDVTVLPGNSGGPAFNEDGQLVGITTAGLIVLFGFAHMNIMQSVDAILGFGLELQGVK